MRRFIALLIIVMVLISAALAEKRLITTDKNGLALKGYDPVVFHRQQASQRQSSVSGRLQRRNVLLLLGGEQEIVRG
jgi:hypothetical protein